jgi:hypothetical protein
VSASSATDPTGQGSNIRGRSLLREMTATEHLWDGYHVVQAKFRQRPLGTRTDGTWLMGQVAAELTQWSNPESRRRKQGELPDYLIVTTNVVLLPLRAAALTGSTSSLPSVIGMSAPEEIIRAV